MGTLRPSYFLWVLTALLLADNVHLNECPENDDESLLQHGQEYSYHFQTEAFGESVGTTNDRSRIKIDCDVLISHNHDCFYNLKMSNCFLTAAGGPPESETPWIDHQELKELMRYPIMFSLDNGNVRQVYADNSDPLFYVNLKKGALSSFVFKMSAVSEKIQEMHTDIHGVCPFTSSPVPGITGGVKTTKDMLYCALPSRQDWQFSPWSIFWNMSFIQYVINSTADCDYVVNINEKRLDKVHCKERHAIMLESTHRTTTAVQTNILYSMDFRSSKKLDKTTRHNLLPRKTSISFEYDKTPDPVLPPANFVIKLKEMLSDLVEASQEEIRLFTITQFTEFVAWLRSSNNLLDIASHIRSCKIFRESILCTDENKALAFSYLKDALVQCNTVPCIEAVANLAVKGDLSSAYLNFVLYSWGNMHYTKPKILEYVKKICEAKDSEFCWLTLGTMAKNIYRRISFAIESEELNILKDATSHLYSEIRTRPYCQINVDDPKHRNSNDKYRELLTHLKAIGNMEEVSAIIDPLTFVKISECVLKQEHPVYIRTAALQTLHKIGFCVNSENCKYSIKEIRNLLFNSSVDMDIRISVYNLLMLSPEEQSFHVDIIQLLNEEKNSQILSYISTNLESVLSDSHYQEKHKDFIQKLTKSLKDNDISLLDFHRYDERKSYSSSHGGFAKLPFLPTEMQGFGFKVDTSVIYPFYNMIPETFKSNFTLQLFNKVINLFQSEIHVEGWHNLGILLQKALLEFDFSATSQEKLVKNLHDVIYIFSQSDSVSPNSFTFDENILQNIMKIIDMYQKPKTELFFSLNFDMLRRALNFITSEDLIALSTLTEKFYDLLEDLNEGISSRNTHVIRVIEAYHQVPTMMGLPLNWTTNATLAFSLNKGLKLNYGEKNQNLNIHAEVELHPSAALTFLNRMVLDFPTITQMGIQANSSAYTSTQLKALFDYSGADHTGKLQIKKPEKSQKVLELFRTNQIIKHNSYHEIPDWDITRTSAEWCLGDSVSTVIGLQLCHERSYPKVTHLIKPWALMAGWCKWRLDINPYDSGLEYYNIVFSKSDKEADVEKMMVKFDAPSSKLNREIIIDILSNKLSKEMTVNVKVPELPDFSISASSSRLLQKEKVSGYKSLILLKIMKDMKYEFVYSKEDRNERKQDTSDLENKPPKSKKQSVFVQERLVMLETPFNDYKWTRKMYKQGGNVKNDMMISYENSKSEWNWLSQILPPVFWQSKSKAWLQIRSNWKSPSHKMKDTITYSTKNHITTPQTFIELTTNSLKMSGRKQFVMNVTKTEKTTKKLLSFANFTYDLWSSQSSESSSKEIRLFNLTIPRRSWSFQMQTVVDNNKRLYDATFSRAQLTPKNNIKSDYVGWWSEEARHQFDLKQHQLKLDADLDTKILDRTQLSEDFPNLPDYDDIKDVVSRYTAADVNLYYPLYNNEERINFNGKFLLSYSDKLFRYQKDFVLFSTYHGLQLNSHSVYKAVDKQRLLTHGSFFTRVSSGAKAFYNLDYNEFTNDNECVDRKFNHNISSTLFDMSGNVSYLCNSENSHMHTLHLDSRTYSPQWNMLNSEISQIIEDVDSEYTQEYMNFTHPLMIINVTADWRGKNHKKNAIFKMQPKDVKIFEINFETEPRKAQLKLDIYNKEKMSISYQRRISDDNKQLKINIHSNDADGDLINIYGKVINPQDQLWKFEIYPAVKNVIQKIRVAWQNAKTAGGAITEDPNHPLNHMLQPFLKMPLAEYVSSVKQEVKEGLYNYWNLIKEIVKSLDGFYQPSVDILSNIYNEGKAFITGVYNDIKDKSITIWAINYFELPQLLQRGLMNIPYSITMLRNMIFPSNQVTKFSFHTGRVLNWNSFNEFPYLDLNRIQNYLPLISTDPSRKVEQHHHKTMGSKVAMIFGPRHVYTFDGHIYEFPVYPSTECAFLLFHDIHKSMFSALTTHNTAYVLFPEMTVGINYLNEVFVNGSDTPSSLPIQSRNGKVVVKRHGDVVEIWSPLLIVHCYSKGFLCSFELTGWSGGGIMGLLGNADGEAFNDYMLPNGVIVDDLLEFAKAYELSGQSICQDLKFAKHSIARKDHEHCLNHLKYPCAYVHHLIKPFADFCAIDLGNDDGMCYSISGLSTLCYYENQDAKSNCYVERQESKNIRHKLQVVLLVNELGSMFNTSKNIPHKGLESVIDALEEQFKTNGYSTILYNLIGFGGKDVRYSPSVHMVNSELWVPHKVMVNELLKTLHFRGNQNFNAVDAVKYALDVVGHDTFDTKVFIMFTKEDNETSDKATLHAVQDDLERNGITLYTFAEYPSIEKGKKVYGVRADGLMFPVPKKEESYLDYPHGDLAKLTSATRGSLFLQKFVESNSPAAFFTEFAQEVWARVRREVQHCRECKTIRSGWWYYYNECRIVKC